MKDFVLGVHSGFLGASVLMSDGGICCAVAEERLSRVKNDGNFKKSLQYVLNEANADLADIKVIAVDDVSAAAYLRSAGYHKEITIRKDEPLNFAFAAFGASGFDRALVVVNDFAGLYFYKAQVGSNGLEISLLEKAKTDTGIRYEEVTNCLGFDGQGEAGKTMALAACTGLAGAEKAFSVQKDFEADFTSAVLQAAEKYGYAKIAITGGMALNCIANGKLLAARNGIAEDLFVLPCAGRDGIALGLAYQAGNGVTLPLQNVYLGKEYREETYLCNLRLGKNLSVKKVAEGGEVYQAAAELIHKGKVLCCFQNRAEFGPRALGNRSILAAPFLPVDTKKKLDSIKSREVFRPYAPSVLQEYAGDFFEMQGLRQSPFMLFGVRVKEEKYPLIKDVCHTDKTSRIQTVSNRQNPAYYRLIEEYAKLSGLPMVLNTSFNRAKEPIAETPSDAVDCFLNTAADALLLQDILWQKA